MSKNDPTLVFLIYEEEKEEKRSVSNIEYLRSIFSEMDDNCLFFEGDRMTYCVNYLSGEFRYECDWIKQKGLRKGLVFSLYLDSNDKENQSNEYYEMIESLVYSLQHKKNKNIIVTKVWDKSSFLLCYKAYAPVARYERLLKQFINEVLCMNYDTNWHETVLKHNVANKSVNTRIENTANKGSQDPREIAIEQLDFSSLYDLIFKKIPNLAKKNIDYDNLSGYSKDELIDIVRFLQPKSVWDNISEKLNYLCDFEKEAKEIQELRNKVMHSSTLLYEEYKRLIELCNRCNELLTRAIAEINSVFFDSRAFIESLSALAGLPIMMKTISQLMNPLSDFLGEGSNFLHDLYDETDDEDNDEDDDASSDL